MRVSPKINNVISGLVSISFGFFLISLAVKLPSVKHINFGPGFFPLIVGYGFVIAGIFLLMSSTMWTEKTDFWKLSRNTIQVNVYKVLQTLPVFFAMVFYIWFAEAWGFLPVMMILLTGLMYWFGNSLKRSIAVSFCATLILHSFFYQLMKVSLPWGVLESYSGLLTW